MKYNATFTFDISFHAGNTLWDSEVVSIMNVKEVYVCDCNNHHLTKVYVTARV